MTETTRPDPFEQLTAENLENGPLGLLMGMTPARFDFVRNILEIVFAEPKRCRVLDVGCGIGLLSEPVARLGCEVTAVDRSRAVLDLARRRACQQGLEIDFQCSDIHRPPGNDGEFDVALCCDVLEHVEDPSAVVRESARILRNGGVLIYSTLNRTFASWLVAIKALQEWPFSRLLPETLHAWHDFITPSELHSWLAACGLQQELLRGFAPGASPLSILANLRRCKRGEISAEHFGRLLEMSTCRSTRFQYFGYARKNNSLPHI